MLCAGDYLRCSVCCFFRFFLRKASVVVAILIFKEDVLWLLP